MKIDCIKCGLRPAVSGGLCYECLSESIHVRLKDELSLKECRKCGSVQVGKYWHDSLSPASLETEVKGHLQLTAPRLRLRSVEVTSFNMQDRTLSGSVTLEDAQGETISKEFVFPLEVHHQSCPRCNRISGSSFEAIVQVRSMLDAPSKEFDSITNKIRDYAESIEDGKGGNYILKEKKVRGGLDIYLGGKAIAEKIVHMAPTVAVCSIQRTKKLFSRKDGQDLFRYTYLVRIMDVPRGNGIYVNEREYIVTEASSSVVKLLDPVAQRVVDFAEKDFFRRRLKVSQNQGTYEEVKIVQCVPGGFTIAGQDGNEVSITAPMDCKEGDKVKLFKYRGKFYYLP